MKYSGSDIRRKFITYFSEGLAHKAEPSASLIPNNPTVLLTPAGMLPFVPIFLGIEPPPSPPRVVSSQKCARVSGKASDLGYVGRTPRHHTFFEMLGNFSFGDYFKAEVIPWAWRFVTEELGLDKSRLWVTIHHTDQEAREIWEKQVGVSPDRIIERGDKDNFWGPPGPTGPCGPCTEIFVDRGEQYAHLVDPNEHFLDSDRYVEIWNLVFMELFQDAEGKRTPLEKKNVDTGMGLERITMVMQGVENTFETDLLYPILNKLGEYTGHKYHDDPEIDVALKIVTDHMRCVAFAIADGITPSNEGRGYIIRMILRRAIRYAKQLGMQAPLLFKLVSVIRDLYQDAYPELKTHYSRIVETVQAEEKRFLETLERGNKLFDEVVAGLKASGKKEIPGEEAFKLYDTYGFPVELTEELAQELGLTVDQVGFESAMKAQREKARAAQGTKAIVQDQVYSEILSATGATRFLGYDSLDAEAKVVALIAEGQSVESFGGVNQPFDLILDQTPFYGESGGQVGDKGILYVEAGQKAQTIVVKDTQKVGDLFVHKCLFDQGGTIALGVKVRAEVNPDGRLRTARNHSATHLLHSALKKVLGDSVSQAGSFVGPDGARFDVNFPRAISTEELQKVEMMVNQWVMANTPREVLVTDIETAKASGAVAMFNEKYAADVRVVSFGEQSKELCGGTHVDRLGDIGLFKITSEGAVAAGIRRLEFVTGQRALHELLQLEVLASELSTALKIPVREIPERLEKLMDEKKQLEKRLKDLDKQSAVAMVKTLVEQLKQAESPVLIEKLSITSADALKVVADELAGQVPQSVVFLAAEVEGKALFICHVGSEAQSKGLQAGALVKVAAQLCEGGGGGKPGFAQAGGKTPGGITSALAAVMQAVTDANLSVARR